MRRLAPVAIILAFFCFSVFAAEVVEGPSVDMNGTSAVVRWKTDVACGSHVRFGGSAEALTRKAQADDVTVDHQVTLDGLESGAVYYFSVGTSRKALATGKFTASGKGTVSAKGGSSAPSATAAKPTPAPEKKAADAPVRKAPPTDKIWGYMASLPDHFARHGGDFGARSPDDYARMSWEFLQRALEEGLPAKFDDSDGTLRVWDGRTHTFAAYNRNFTTKTFFKPESASYFERQPGKPVKLQRKK